MPAYGFPKMTKECVEAVKKNAGMDIDILVVDDGSKEPYKDDTINVLRINENTGFTNATNQGMLWCGVRYKYLLFLNNDIFPKPNFVKILYDYMEKDYVTGIASSTRFTYVDGKKQYIGYGMDLIRGIQSMTYECESDEVFYCDWVPTCSCLIRMDMIRYIGILDRQFHQHCSDSEYCIRANQNGWNVVLMTKSQVEHKHQTTIQHIGIEPYTDQKKFIRKLAGVKYQELMNRLPLDIEMKTWGRVTFEKYKKDDNTNKSTTT